MANGGGNIVNPQGVPDAHPGPLRWTLTLLGLMILIGAWTDAVPQGLVRWLMTLGGLVVILLAPAAARSLITSIRLTDEGVTGAGFLGPVHIPWSEVVRVYDDVHGITVQSAKRSARIDLTTITVKVRVGGLGSKVRIPNFGDTSQVVAFVLAHIPKSAMIEMRYWLPG